MGHHSSCHHLVPGRGRNIGHQFGSSSSQPGIHQILKDNLSSNFWDFNHFDFFRLRSTSKFGKVVKPGPFPHCLHLRIKHLCAEVLAMDLAALLNRRQPNAKKRPAHSQRHVVDLDSDSDAAADPAGHQPVAIECGRDPLSDPQLADCWPGVGNMSLLLTHFHLGVAKASVPSTDVSAGAIVSGLLLV